LEKFLITEGTTVIPLQTTSPIIPGLFIHYHIHLCLIILFSSPDFLITLIAHVHHRDVYLMCVLCLHLEGVFSIVFAHVRCQIDV